MNEPFLLSNLVELQDLDSDGPWLVEYYWEEGEWKEISPSCVALDDYKFECQADILAHDLSFGDHKLYLRINDGVSISEVETFWLEKEDPDAGTASSNILQGKNTALIFIIGGILLLLGAGALIISLSRRNEYV